jgi:hypothetical protein
LALQVAGFNIIAIQDGQLSYACSRQQGRNAGAGGAATHHGHSPMRKPFLAGRAYSREEYLSRISIKERHTFFYYMFWQEGSKFENRRT